jgi:hypothetical protein
VHAWPTRSRARRGRARCRAVQRIIVRAALRRAPSMHAWRRLPAPWAVARVRSRASPRGHRVLVGLLPGLRMAVGFPLGPSGLTTQGVRAPVSARARCHQAQPGRTERCEEAATRGQRAGRRRSPRRATDGATRPVFADGRPGVGLSSCTRRCHRSARSRAWRADSSPRASRRSACAATASASAAMAANSSSRFNAPETPGRRLPNGRCLKTEACGASAGFVDKVTSLGLV